MLATTKSKLFERSVKSARPLKKSWLFYICVCQAIYSFGFVPLAYHFCCSINHLTIYIIIILSTFSGWKAFFTHCRRANEYMRANHFVWLRVYLTRLLLLPLLVPVYIASIQMVKRWAMNMKTDNIPRSCSLARLLLSPHRIIIIFP